MTRAHRPPQMMECEKCGRSDRKRNYRQRFCRECSSRSVPVVVLKCVDCGASFERRGWAHVRCDDCGQRHINEIMRGHQKRYDAAHREQKREYLRAWRAANPRPRRPSPKRVRTVEQQEQRREQQRAYYARNRQKERERSLEKAHRRRAEKLANPSCEFTAESWERVQAAFEHRCAYCGRGGTLSQDHVVPLIQGGEHCECNVVPACIGCNQVKGRKGLVQFLLYLRSLAGLPEDANASEEV